MCTKVSAVCYRRFPKHRSWHMRRRWHCFCAPRVSTGRPCVPRMCQAAVRTARHQCRVHHVRRCSVTQRAARVGCWASPGGQAGPSAFPGSATHGDKKPRALHSVCWARLPWLLLECSYFSGFNHPRWRPCFSVRECHSKVTHSESVGAHAMDVQVGESVRTYWAPWRHGSSPGC